VPIFVTPSMKVVEFFTDDKTFILLFMDFMNYLKNIQEL